MQTKKIYDGNYSDYSHGLTKKEYASLKEKGRVWLSLNP